MTSVRILWWVMGHVGYHFAFSIICFHVGKWSLQLLWQPYSRDRLQGSHIPLKFVFLWESSSSGHSGALWFKCFSPTREYLATIAPYCTNQSYLQYLSIHIILSFHLQALCHIFISPFPPKASCSKKIPRFPWILRFCQWLLKENPLDFSSATFAAYVAQLMREAGRAKVRAYPRQNETKTVGSSTWQKPQKFLSFTKNETDVFQFLIDSLIC